MKNEESHNKHIKNVKTRQPATNSPRSFFLSLLFFVPLQPLSA